MRFFFVFTFLSISFLSISQDVPKHYIDTAGNIYWRKSAPVHLFVSESPDGKNPKRLTSRATPEYSDPFYLDTEGVNYIRSRNAVDPETKQVIPNTEVKFEIYADGIAPVSTVDYRNVSQYRVENTLYYKSGLEIELNAKDETSGVKKLEYSLNGQQYRPYQKALQFSSPGKYTLKFRSQDNVGNKEEEQEVSFAIDAQAPYSDLNINGITEDNVVSQGSKMYLLAEDSLSRVKSVLYKFDDQSYQKYNGYELPFAELEEGDHTITYYAEDYVGNKEKEKSFSFFLDKSAPLMVADVLGDRFIVEDEIYFSGRTKLKLTAVDNKVGVKEIMYSIDDQEFKKYENPFYLPSISGVHIIKYYSVDYLSNSTADSKNSRYIGEGGFEQFKHNVNKFYVDLTGPVINHDILEYSFTRSDTLFLGPYSKIRLQGEDPESGLQKLTFSFAGEVGETTYIEPFALSSEGYKQLDYYGYDNVNNRNVAKLSFYLDATPPDIYIQFSAGKLENKDGAPVYPASAGIFLSATDRKSGVSSVTYSLDDGPYKPYAGLITQIKKGKHTLKVKAKDVLNNQFEKETVFQIQ